MTMIQILSIDESVAFGRFKNVKQDMSEINYSLLSGGFKSTCCGG